jgi:DNA repair protein RecO (recombination protein O)
MRGVAVAGSLKTEAIVLRSIRFGEADRILHLYTPEHGRLGAIAKGARRARSRFGARLEPFFQIKTVLHEGRGELYTVTAVDTIEAHAGLRESAAALDAAARACDAVTRLFETNEPHPEVYALLASELTLLDLDPARPAAARAGNALAFRLKLLLAAGIVPQLASCASCGEREHLTGFSAAAGGVVCSSCESASFPLDQGAYEFMVAALGRPLAEAPDASGRALQMVERAIRETAEHHAQVRLRPVSAASGRT